MDDVLPVCLSLAEALHDDPFYRAVTIESGEDEQHRKAVLADYFALAMTEALGIGEVQYARDDGAAIWHTNEAAEKAESFIMARKHGLAKLLGDSGFGNYTRISQSMSQHIPLHLSNAWYLSILGIRPAARGQGLAQRLIERTLSRADREGAVCFLETFNPLSLPFYRRLGFQDAIACFEKLTERDYWILTRHPISSD